MLRVLARKRTQKPTNKAASSSPTMPWRLACCELKILTLWLCHDYHILHTHIYSHWTYHHDVIRNTRRAEHTRKHSAASNLRRWGGKESFSSLRQCLVVAVLWSRVCTRCHEAKKACEENDTLKVLLLCCYLFIAKLHKMSNLHKLLSFLE